MTTKYTRDGIVYRSYVTDTGGFDAFGRVLMAAHAYEDLGVPVTHVVLRSSDGRSLDRLRNDEIVPPAGAVVLTSDSNGADDEAWSTLHEWALRHGVTRVVSVLVCPRNVDETPASAPGSVASPDDMRALGFEVTVHLDYQYEGKPRVFWCLTLGTLALKATGATDQAADHCELSRLRMGIESATIKPWIPQLSRPSSMPPSRSAMTSR